LKDYQNDIQAKKVMSSFRFGSLFNMTCILNIKNIRENHFMILLNPLNTNKSQECCQAKQPFKGSQTAYSGEQQNRKSLPLNLIFLHALLLPKLRFRL
jgi:hypothetical protein